MPDPAGGKPLPRVGLSEGVTVADVSVSAPGPAAQETLLAFDYGTRKLGVAVGNTITGQARGLEIIPAASREARYARIGELLETWRPQRLVVGLSLAPDGSEQHASLQGRRFANQLYGRYGLPVVLVDERGSSMEAQEELGGHGPDDAVAAAIILQRYLDALSAPAI